MTRVVPDTNIIISAIFWSGKPYKVISSGLRGEYQLVTSPEIIDEVLTKLRNKFQFPEDKIEEQANILMSLFHMIIPITKIDIVRDKSDNKIIECAVDGKADFIVTGDPDLLTLKEYNGIRILTADELFNINKSH
ncbi:MAG: putative toxin-antitoxin system toxin component, PIN family [Candidatus Aenigmarchaeota archaeon]|nr:putative toxin-antitoxin system toxin component, PIN family [Candidatus Aenigmarchaeota archaeon]